MFSKSLLTCAKNFTGLILVMIIVPWIKLGCNIKNDWCEVRKILDIDIYLFIEKEMTGGVSYIAKRYATTNNKYMKNYDPKKPSKFVTYLDMNNVYGWAMNDYLPYGTFKWLKNVDAFCVKSIAKRVWWDIFSKLILNILMNYMHRTTIMHYSRFFLNINSL